MRKVAIDSAHDEVLQVLQKHKLTDKELTVLYGNLGYSIGASLDGLTGTGPTVDELRKKYYSSPSVGTAMMLQGILTTHWVEDINKQTEEK